MQVRWSHEDKEVHVGPELVLKEVAKTDLGQYVCVIESKTDGEGSEAETQKAVLHLGASCVASTSHPHVQ